MKNRTFVRWVALPAVGCVAFLTACREAPLEVENPNQPDIGRAFATAALTEGLTSRLFQQMFNGLYATGGNNIWVQTLVIGFESGSALGNFGMGARSAIPRPLIDNSIGNSVKDGNFRDYDYLSRNGRSAANAIRRLRELNAAGIGLPTAAQNARAMSFAWFSLGFAMGHISTLYDSAGVITPEFSNDFIPPLSHYSVVNAEALRMLDSALAYAGGATATAAQVTASTTGLNGWPIPTTAGSAWISTDRAVDKARWIRIINSYEAKFRAGVARTPTERAAVDWAKVITNATRGLGTAGTGINEDFVVVADETNGWSMATLQQLRVDPTWSQMTPFYLGMGDTTGAYDAWLQTAVNSTARQTAGSTFLLRTPDKRFPSGDNRGLQQTASGGSVKTGTPAGTILYFRNRPTGDDQAGYSWGTWQYDNQRFWSIGSNGGNGPWVMFSQAENDLLAAEGYFRTGQHALGIDLVNRYRARAGLAAIPTSATQTSTVPGGAACVPRVPQPPDFTTTACGTVFEAMKWEKRLETAFTGHSQWFIDGRGWGDLYAASPLEWPVPYQETFARYGTGSYYLSQRAAAVGTYGFGRSTTF